MLRIGIVGCGKIADSHLSQIQRIADCRVVGVCDREPLMAEQLADRFPVEACYENLSDLLGKGTPDVVHITTPPGSHFKLARQSLEAGCHVYVEKPFTLNTEDAETLIELAESLGLKLTAGHDDQFRHAARRMRALVQGGYLGNGVVHMESYYGYDLGSQAYAQSLVADKSHWVRRLPGGLIHNNISHGVARIAEFMSGDCPRVVAEGFVSSRLREMGEESLIDEMRAMITDERGVTAYLTFSAQMRPCLHQFRIFGDRNGLQLDQGDETVIRLPGRKRKSYLQFFVPPVGLAGQYLGNLAGNVRKFLGNDFQMKSGMKYLIEAFYSSIRHRAPLPIDSKEILRTARIMDRLFEQLHPSES